MSSSTTGTGGGSTGWIPPSVSELQTLLPQYEIESMIGCGGMGAVYKGRQITLHRTIAIKVLPETLVENDETHQYADRFRLEARAMANLDHSAIISVFDFGQTTAGQLYFVMEFIDGMDIEKYIEASGGQVSPEHAVSIVSHVLDALNYAHSKGIVHRDIKPANVLINREGRVKIADFGLAKQFSGDAAEMAGLTLTNMAVGTPDYIAPEALEAGTSPDHRADLYAVGVMLYRMLTGKLPRGMFKLPTEQISGLDERFDEIIAYAMESDPEVRFQSASEFRSKLDELQSAPISKIDADQPSGNFSPAVSVNSLPSRLAKRSKLNARNRTDENGKKEPRRGLAVLGATAVILIGSILLFMMRPWEESEDVILEDPGGRVIETAENTRVPKGSDKSESTVMPETPEVDLPPPTVPTTVDAQAVTSSSSTDTLPTEPSAKSAGVSISLDSDKDSDNSNAATREEIVSRLPPAIPTGISELDSRLSSYRDYRKKTLGNLIVALRKELNQTRQEAVTTGNLTDVEEADLVIETLNSYTTEIGDFLKAADISGLPLPEFPDELSDPMLKTLDKFKFSLLGAESDMATTLSQSLEDCQKDLTQRNQIEEAGKLRDYRQKLIPLLTKHYGPAISVEPPVATATDSFSQNKEMDLNENSSDGQEDSSVESSEPWQELMNGSDFTGWNSPSPNGWSIQSNGFVSSKANNLFTPFSHRTFELEGEVLVSAGGNGGVFFLGNNTGARCYEMAMVGSRKTGHSGVYTGGLFAPHTDFKTAKRTSPGRNLIDDDEWTTFRILVTQEQIVTWIDGKEAVTWQIETEPTQNSHVGIQGGRGTPVGYRNLRFRVIP